MSDSEDGTDGADTGDDDGFDKEAERERLREKYERDKQRREATEKMSELLLQGATMTNKHCDACGSPVFRYDGEEFCPSCGGTRDVAAADADEGEGAPTEGTDPDERPTTASPQASGQPDDGGRPDEPAAGGDGRERLSPERSLQPDPSELQADRDVAPGGRTADRGSPPSGTIPAGGTSEAPSLAQARASLRRAIVSLSEQAAQSDDPVRAKNLLEAAREGAEALAELGGDEV